MTYLLKATVCLLSLVASTHIIPYFLFRINFCHFFFFIFYFTVICCLDFLNMCSLLSYNNCNFAACINDYIKKKCCARSGGALFIFPRCHTFYVIQFNSIHFQRSYNSMHSFKQKKK